MAVYCPPKICQMVEEDRIFIKPLGAGNEVGRSCIHVKYKEKELLLDCGVHPAYAGVSALPFLDLVDLSKINAVLVTHFHLDHAAALPFLTEKTAFRGKVYMTHPTKAILKWLLNDYIRVINSSSEQDFYTEEDLENCYSKIIPIDYHQQVAIEGIKFTALNAGHALGAAMFLLEIEKSTLLYTGDYSREEDWHLKAAESPGCKLDALITESTYGVQCHLPRAEREHRFTSTVTDIVLRGGRCLLPVFALGRAQELLLILEEHWRTNPSLRNVPIYYVSALARRCMAVYQTYVNMMNERIQRISLKKNPFEFSYVQSLRDMQTFKDEQPCVMMASPGMLQSGVSRELFERWCSDPRNGVVIPGYCVAGTLAKDILSEPKEVESMRGGMLKLNMSVEYISFSAHADYTQNSQFIDECAPANLFFVHGEMNEMMRLKNMIGMRNEKSGVQMNLFALRNGEEGSFEIVKNNDAMIYTDKERFESLIVANGAVRIYDRDDLSSCEFKQLRFRQRQKVPFNSTFALFRQILITEYEAEEIEDDGAILESMDTFENKHSDAPSSEGSPGQGEGDARSTLVSQPYINSAGAFANDRGANGHSDECVAGAAVRSMSTAPKCLKVGNVVVRNGHGAIFMEWEGNYVDDVVAMAISKSIREIGHNVKSVCLSKASQLETLCDTLRGYYSDIQLEDQRITVRWHDKLAFVENMMVTGSDSEFIDRISSIVQKVRVLFA